VSPELDLRNPANTPSSYAQIILCFCECHISSR